MQMVILRRLFFFGLLLAAVASPAASDLKFAYVDIQKAIQETTAGKSAKKEYEEEIKKKQAEIKQRESDIKKMTEDFEKKSMVLSEDVKARKQGEIQQEMMKYQEVAAKTRLFIQKRERELLQPILDKLRSVIDELAKEQKYAFVFEKSEQSIVWANDKYDITDQVIKRFEKKMK